MRFEDPYEGWPPVKVYPDGHLDLEFGPLLLASSIVMDSESYQRLMTFANNSMFQAASSLEILRDTGFLKLVDYSQAVEPWKRDIIDIVNKEVGSPTYYLEHLRKAASIWESSASPYSRVIGRPEDLIANIPVGFLQALEADGKPVTQLNIQKLRSAVFKTRPPTRGESQRLGEVLRPYLEQVLTNLAVSKFLDSTISDWPDIWPMYRSVLRSHLEDAPRKWEHIPTVRELFSVCLPCLEPSSAFEFLRALKDPRVVDFRAFITEAAETGSTLDPHLAQHLLISFAGQKKQLAKAGTVLNIIGTAVGVATSVFDGGLTASLVASGGTAVGGELLSKRMNGIIHRDTGWLLCLLNAKKP